MWRVTASYYAWLNTWFIERSAIHNLLELVACMDLLCSKQFQRFEQHVDWDSEERVLKWGPLKVATKIIRKQHTFHEDSINAAPLSPETLWFVAANLLLRRYTVQYDSRMCTVITERLVFLYNYRRVRLLIDWISSELTVAWPSRNEGVSCLWHRRAMSHAPELLETGQNFNCGSYDQWFI